MCALTVPLKNHNPLRRRHGNVILLGILDGVVKRRRTHGWAFRCYRCAEGLYQAQEPGTVKGELGASSGVCRGGVGHGVKLCAREVVAVHGYECRDGRGGGM